MEIKVQENIDEEYGFNTFKIEGFIEGKRIAFVNVAWLTYKRFEEKYPNIWEYMYWVEKWPCWSKLPQNYDPLTEDQIFEMARLRNGMITEKSEVEKMEKSIWETYGFKHDEFRDKYVQKPYVEYVWVEKEFRNKGYAKELYKWTSEWLWEKWGLELRSGETRTQEGEWLWQSMQRSFDNIVVDGNQFKISVDKG
jgi:GNAT superfamily N-acetyltransferase